MRSVAAVVTQASNGSRKGGMGEAHLAALASKEREKPSSDL